MAKTGIWQVSSGQPSGAITFPSLSPHDHPGEFSSPGTRSRARKRLYFCTSAYWRRKFPSWKSWAGAVNTPPPPPGAMSNHAKLISETFHYPRSTIWMVLLACGCHNQPGAYSLLWEASPGAANTGSQQWLNLHIINSESQSQQGNCDCRFWVIGMDLSCSYQAANRCTTDKVPAKSWGQTTPWCHFLITDVNLGKLNCVWVQKRYVPLVQRVARLTPEMLFASFIMNGWWHGSSSKVRHKHFSGSLKLWTVT